MSTFKCRMYGDVLPKTHSTSSCVQPTGLRTTSHFHPLTGVVLPPCVVPGDSMEIPHANEQQQHLDENKKKHTCSISDSSSSKKSIAATVVFTPWENTKATNYFRHHCHTFLSISQEHRYKRKHEQVHCTYLIVSTSIDTSFSNLPSKLIKLQ